MAHFEYTIIIQPQHLDDRNHVNNVVYVQFMQDAAEKHWNSKVSPATDAKVVWVVRKHEIEYHNPALLNDELLMKTWTGEYSAAAWDRHYEITRVSDNKKIITAKSTWVLLDRETLRPKRVDETVLAVFR